MSRKGKRADNVEITFQWSDAHLFSLLLFSHILFGCREMVQAGCVGMTLRAQGSRFFVVSMKKGGPADSCTEISLGDELVSVGDVDLKVRLEGTLISCVYQIESSRWAFPGDELVMWTLPPSLQNRSGQISRPIACVFQQRECKTRGKRSQAFVCWFFCSSRSGSLCHVWVSKSWHFVVCKAKYLPASGCKKKSQERPCLCFLLLFVPSTGSYRGGDNSWCVLRWAGPVSAKGD